MKPITESKPVEDIPQYKEASDEDVEMAALRDINNDLDDDFLSDEEVKKYLALKTPKHFGL